jgi:hypothetical protein
MPAPDQCMLHCYVEAAKGLGQAAWQKLKWQEDAAHMRTSIDGLG